MAVASGVRARVRAELVAEIKQAARRQLAEEGAAALSLRAVARELGMVSSGIYRYFSSRDQLLTALIVDAYDALGEAAEQADATVGRDDFFGRWAAACRAVRGFAVANLHEYALLYGSPVPGYRAPEATVAPATRTTVVLTSVVAEAFAAGVLAPPPLGNRVVLTPAVRSEARRIAELVLPGVGVDAVVRCLAAWTQLFGYVSFERFGHLVGAVERGDEMFDAVVASMAAYVGLPVAPARPRRAGAPG